MGLPGYYTEVEVAKILGTTVAVLRSRRCNIKAGRRGKVNFPPHVKLYNGRIVYSIQEFEEWFQKMLKPCETDG